MYYRRIQMIEFLTVNEFAQKLKVQPRQVYTWIEQGRIKALRLNDTPKSPWRIPFRELARLDAEAYENLEET